MSHYQRQKQRRLKLGAVPVLSKGAKALADSMGIRIQDLTGVGLKGSGSTGNVLKADLEAFLESNQQAKDEEE